MTYILGARSLSFVTHVDPRMVHVAQTAIGLGAASLGFDPQDFGFTQEQSRTAAQELIEFQHGFSHTLHSHHEIDINPAWAAPGCSGALDAVAWDGTKFVWEWPRQYVIAAMFKKAFALCGLTGTWGGYWAGTMDQIPGDTPAAMQAVQQGPHGGFDGPHVELFRN